MDGPLTWCSLYCTASLLIQSSLDCQTPPNKSSPSITHKGDCLKADEEGERFDAGAEANWATRKHRSFMIHAVAAAAARANYRAAAAESESKAPPPIQ